MAEPEQSYPSANAARSAADPRGLRLAATGLGVLFAVLAGACALQALFNLRANAARTAADRSATAAAEQVAKTIVASGAKLDDLGRKVAAGTLGSPEGRRAVGLRLSKDLGEDAVIEIYDPQVPELGAANLSLFGFTRAAVLAEARDRAGLASAQVRRGPNGWRVVQARPVSQDERWVAILYADLPIAVFAEAIENTVAKDPIQLELRQRSLDGGSLTVGAFGPQRLGSIIGKSVPVRGSQLEIGALYPSPFEVDDVLPMLTERSNFGLLLIAALLALASVAAFWVRARRLGSSYDTSDEGLEVMPADVHSVPAPPSKTQRQSPHAAATAAAAAAVGATHAEPAQVVPRAASAPAPRQVEVERSIFRAYDIRGVMGKTLSPEIARAIGASIGSEARERGLREIVVGRDGRLSGPVLVEGLIDGLRSTGCDVIDIGLVPTPVLYFATYHLNVGSGVMLTGSHNPPDHNGFKIVLGGETLSGEAIQGLYARLAESRIVTGSGGLQELDVRRDYIDRIAGDVQVERKLRVVVDAGNGAAGEVGPAVLEAIGCDVVQLNCEIDGNFPSHHPDPSDPANLQDLLVSVKQFNADIGIAYDGDGDRLGVVTQQGEIINPDRLLMLFARDVLGRVPGATIIYDVKCTGKLHEVILGHGGSPIMWKTGHSLIKAKMREEDAELAGEMSGHFFFRERWFGFDDGIYASARLSELLASTDRTATEVFRDLPNATSTPELKVPMAEGRTHAFADQFARRALFPGARLTTLDGIRADWPDGWGLVRSSNTTSVLVMRFEADNADALSRIQDEFRKQLLALDPALVLPF